MTPQPFAYLVPASLFPFVEFQRSPHAAHSTSRVATRLLSAAHRDYWNSEFTIIFLFVIVGKGLYTLLAILGDQLIQNVILSIGFAGLVELSGVFIGDLVIAWFGGLGFWLVLCGRFSREF